MRRFSSPPNNSQPNTPQRRFMALIDDAIEFLNSLHHPRGKTTVDKIIRILDEHPGEIDVSTLITLPHPFRDGNYLYMEWIIGLTRPSHIHHPHSSSNEARRLFMALLSNIPNNEIDRSDKRPDKNGFTMLRQAIEYNAAPEVVRALLLRNANVDLPDERGITPIMAAASKGREDIVRLLMEKGAELELTNRDGRTVYNHATNSIKRGILAPSFPVRNVSHGGRRRLSKTRRRRHRYQSSKIRHRRK